MSNDKDFSLENSEELIANLKSGKPSEFEQLRSALSLLAHVAELPPTTIPPVLPSSIAQPVPVLPVKSSRPRRTIVTSVMVAGLFASASLAAAAVTGIGPAAIVNVGHQAAKLVRVVVGGVTQVVTGNPSTSAQSQAESASTPLPIPSLSPAPSITEEQDESEHPTPIIPALTNLFPPSSNESDSSHENESQKPNSSKETSSSSHESSDESSNSSHESKSPSVEDSPTSTPKGEKEHTNAENQRRPSGLPSITPSEDNSDENSPSPIPLAEPTPSPSDQPEPTPSPSDQPSEDE